MGAKYKFRTKPYVHQMKAIRKMVASDFGLALLMDPRTGKTKTCIDYMGIMHLKYGLEKIMVVCPNRVMGVWLRELIVHSPLLIQTVLWDRAGRKKYPRIPDKDPMYDLQVVIINYEAFSVPGKKLPSGRRSKASGRFKTRAEIAKWIGDDDALCVLDESHKIKNPSGKAATMIVSMRPLFRWRVLATGTAVTKANRAHDIFMQWKFLNPERFAALGLTTHDDFKQYFGRWVEQDGYSIWKAPRHLAELHQEIHKDSFAVAREDCFDLPPREDLIHYVTIKGETARVYDDMAKQMFSQLMNGELVEASIMLVQTLRLCQITGGTATTPAPEKETYRIGSEKLVALKPYLEDAQERSEKIVVAARFKADLNAIALLCEELGLSCWQLRGGVKRANADRYIVEFRKHSDAGVFLIQPQSGSLGIDLSTAATMIWYSLPTSFVDFTQACDRIALSRNSTTFRYLLAKGTVDQVLYEALLNDGDVVKAIHSTPEKLLRSEQSRKALLANKDKWRGSKYAG